MKNFILAFPIILVFLLTGCGNNFTPLLNKQKPSAFYYTNEIAENIHNEPVYSCVILDTNLYNEKVLSKNDLDTIHSFLKELKKNNFMSSNPSVGDKPTYRMFLTFSKSKFVINIYGKRYISIFPWDGHYKEDYIDMNGISNAFNLYDLCQFTMSDH